MSDNAKYNIVMTGVVGAIIIGVVWAAAWAYVNSWRALTENGYSETQLQGSRETMWVARQKAPTP